MKTVLGLSVTLHGVAWALVDGLRAAETPLDGDEFDLDATDQLTVRAAAAARSAQTIATSSGQDVVSVGVCVAADVDDDCLDELLDLLTSRFHDVRVVPEDLGGTASMRAARAAAFAVATNAVAKAARPVAARVPAPRKYTAVRAAAAAAAAIATGMLTVGSQHAEPVPPPAGVDADLTAAAKPQLVTVAGPREERRSVVPIEPVEPAPQPVVAVENPAPQVLSVVQLAATAAPQPPAVQATVPHLPAAQPHLATGPAPGPATDPAPGPASGITWLLAAMP